jgi:transcriptional regulator with XRE-family HTH domain
MQTKPFSNNLREFRTRAGLRQIDVARLLNLDYTDRLSHWEHGSAMPNVVNLFKFAVLYKVPPQNLYAELHHDLIKTSEDSTSPIIHMAQREK